MILVMIVQLIFEDKQPYWLLKDFNYDVKLCSLDYAIPSTQVSIFTFSYFWLLYGILGTHHIKGKKLKKTKKELELDESNSILRKTNSKLNTSNNSAIVINLNVQNSIPITPLDLSNSNSDKNNTNKKSKTQYSKSNKSGSMFIYRTVSKEAKIIIISVWAVLSALLVLIYLINLQLFIYQILFSIAWSLSTVALFLQITENFYDYSLKFLKGKPSLFRRIKIHLFIVVFIFNMIVVTYNSGRKTLQVNFDMYEILKMDACSGNFNFFGERKSYINFSLTFGLLGLISGIRFTYRKNLYSDDSFTENTLSTNSITIDLSKSKRKNKLKFYSKIPNYELKNSKYIKNKPFTNFTNSTLNKNTLERLDEQEEKEHSKLSQGTFADERNNIVYSNNSLDEYNKESINLRKSDKSTSEENNNFETENLVNKNNSKTNENKISEEVVETDNKLNYQNNLFKNLKTINFQDNENTEKDYKFSKEYSSNFPYSNLNSKNIKAKFSSDRKVVNKVGTLKKVAAVFVVLLIIVAFVFIRKEILLFQKVNIIYVLNGTTTFIVSYLVSLILTKYVVII